MSGIISADPFNAAIPQTKGNKTMQGFVTAIYEVGKLGFLISACLHLGQMNRWLWRVD